MTTFYRRLCEPVADPATLTSNTVSQILPSAPVGSTKSAKVSTSSASTKATAPSSGSNSRKIKESQVQSTTAVSTPDTKDTNVLSHTTPRRTLFYDMLTTLARDAVDFRNLLHVVIHFMEHTLTLQQEMQVNVTGSNTSTAATAIQLNPLLYRIEPMVLISDQTRVTRMICPPLSVIEQHSAKLATLVKVNIAFLLFYLHCRLSSLFTGDIIKRMRVWFLMFIHVYLPISTGCDGKTDFCGHTELTE